MTYFDRDETPITRVRKKIWQDVTSDLLISDWRKIRSQKEWSKLPSADEDMTARFYGMVDLIFQYKQDRHEDQG